MNNRVTIEGNIALIYIKCSNKEYCVKIDSEDLEKIEKEYDQIYLNQKKMIIYGKKDKKHKGNILKCITKISPRLIVYINGDRLDLRKSNLKKMKNFSYEIHDKIAIITFKRAKKVFKVIVDSDEIDRIVKEFDTLGVTKARSGKYYVWGFKSGDAKGIQLHRFITKAPKGLVVDHRNRNTLDNRKENLLVTTTSVNNTNISGRTISGFQIIYDEIQEKWALLQFINSTQVTKILQFENKKDLITALENIL